MEQVSGKAEKGRLIISLRGRIDSGNARSVEDEVIKLRRENPGLSAVLDCQGLEYISSAGLRVILRLRKEDKDLCITNVSAEVYDIFEMTGFTEMMTVEKAYRELSVEGCDVIGQGSNGKVYRTDPETIVKVYFNPNAIDDIRHERDVARRALILGIPTAIPYDIVRVGDTYGSVFELLNAKPFSQLITEEPERLDYYITMYVDLLKKIHCTDVPGGQLPDQREVALKWVRFLKDHLETGQYEKLYSLVQAVPKCIRMIHGDYHTKNVMLQNDEVLLIDMDTLAVGNPVFEFSSVFLAYRGFGELDHSHVTDFIGVSYETAGVILEETLRRYLGTDDPAVQEDHLNRAKVVGYARLLRRTIRREPDNEVLISHCKKRLAELLPQVDRLAYDLLPEDAADAL